MSSAVARVVFVVALVIQVVVFSQSRYGHPPEAQDSGHSLVKRISTELLNGPTAFSSSANECMPVYIPAPDQCGYVQENCSTSHTFLHFDYLQRYFCADQPLRPLVFTGLVIWLMFLFSTLGISASDFFTPNLATIAQVLRLDENVAGVTFLAFGNGSPDVFSTFSAMRADSGSLAIGELLGAATFIVSCVVGSMCIIKPFQVHRGPFLRDVGFFSAAVAMLLVILWDEQIRPWESVAMIILYLFYVFVVVVGAWWDRKSERRRNNEALARAEYQDEDSPGASMFDEPYRDDPSSISSVTLSPSPRARAISNPGPPRLRTHDMPRRGARTPSPTAQLSSPSPNAYTHLPSFSLVGALEFRQVIASLKTEAATTSLDVFDSPVTPYAGGHYHSHSLSHTRSYSRMTPRSPRSPVSENGEVDPWDRTLGLPMHRGNGSDTPLVDVNSPGGTNHALNGQSHGRGRSVSPMPSITRTPASPTASDTEHEGEIQLFPSPPSKRQRTIRVVKNIYHTIFPSLHNFRNQSFLARTAAIFAAPAVLMLTLTLPVVVTAYEHAHNAPEKAGTRDHDLLDFEEEGIERVLIAEEEMEEEHGIGFNKWLTAAQAILGPVFCVSVLFSGNAHQLWLLLAVTITGLAAAALIVVFADKGDHPSFRMARCSVGFFVSMVWIMAIADEVVQVLRTFGFVFGLSDAIIGLTIFAVGNSLADLVANMSVAVFAPIMGFSACFGGPMLNILLGVGFSGTYITSQTSKPYALHFGTTLFVSGIGLLVLLAATLLVVPFNGYVLTRSWGIFLIISYTVIIVTNVVVELNT